MSGEPRPDVDRRITGPAGAPLVIVHADFSCPDCSLAMRRLLALPIQIDLRHFVLRARGVPARRAAIAAESAGQQGAFWPFAEALLGDLGRQELPDLWALAKRLGLDVDRFEADRRAEVGADRILAETRAAMRDGASTVPAVFAAPEAAQIVADGGLTVPILAVPAT